MKRTTALILALLLAVSLAAPAMAEEPEQEEGTAQEPSVVLWEIDEPEEEEVPAEETPAPEEVPAEPAPETEAPAEELPAGMGTALADLVSQVKKTLQIDDGYTELTNDFYDGVTPYWSLCWSDETRQLNVDVREDGTVLNVNRWIDSGSNDRFYGFDPAFPALSRREAEEQAEDWLSRLFPEPETARVDGVATVLGANGNYRFSGTVDMNGLPSPVTFALCLDGAGLSSFYRSDSYAGYVGRLPEPEAAADETAGAEGLAGAVELELRWVSDGEGGADLRYVPVGPETVVDAQSGEAVDMDALYAGIAGGGVGGKNASAPVAEETMAMDAGAPALTEVELASVDNYGDVMDQDEIDASLRGLTALGLDPFTMQLCSYSMDSASGDITASVRYTAPMTEEELYGFTKSGFDLSSDMELDLVIYKRVTLDAKTGALKSVSTTYPLWEKDPDVTMTQAVRTRAAENFLSLAAPELAAETELCTLKGCSDGDALLYAQVHEGYFYPDNYLSVTVNPGTGTVDAFSSAWEDVKFGSAKEPVTEQEALEAYTGALDVTLGYVAWPVDITLTENELYAKLLEQGYTYVEELRLAYYYGGADRVPGVDGLTGEAVTVPDGQAGQVFVYDDLEDVPQADEIEALGQAGVGFDGGSFLPEAELTQREAVTLLLQADGETVLPEAEDGDLLDRASWRGFVTEDWEPDKTVTRMEFIRMLLCASRYGDAARLLNDKADEGYEAIARALGMDTAEPDGPATRAVAAEMLYRFMDR